MPEQGPHRIHLRMAGGAVAAIGVNLLQNGRGHAERQARPAIFLRNQGAEQPRLRQRIDKFRRIGAFAVLLPPVAAGKAFAELADRLANLAGNIFFHCILSLAADQKPRRVTKFSNVSRSVTSRLITASWSR